MKLVAGSYERFLWGYDLKQKKQELQWKFAYPAHIGPIKCIATSGAVVATGGADDTIRIFDLHAQKDMGSLYKHEGAVTCLDFHNSHPGINHPTHLLSGSDDGSICIWDTDAWIHLLSMKAKKGPKAPVQDLSIHPSGFLALSIERNRNMKMWNLTKGRCSFTTKLPSEAEIVKFFPQGGESYALALGSVMEIRNAETGSTIHRLENDKRIFCMAQRQDNLLVTGGEDCIVRAWDTRSGKLAWSVSNAHTNRIKGVAILGSKSDSGDGTGESPTMVASASSDGLLKVWDTRMVGSEDGAVPVPLMQAETKARLTCLVSSSGVKKIPASESIPEGDGVPDKQRSSAQADVELEKTDKVSKKKKRKTDAGDSDPVEGDTSVPGSKRQKKQSVKVNTKKHGKSLPSTPLPSTTSPYSHTPGSKSPSFRKRSSREKSQDGDVGSVQDHSQQKKRKLSSKFFSAGLGKSPKSFGSGKSIKSSGSGKSIKSPGSGKSIKSPGSGKSIKSPDSGKSIKSPGSGKSIKSPGSGKSIKSPGSGKSIKSPGSGKSIKSPGSGKSIKSPGSGKSGKNRKLQSKS